ncbi:PRTRC system protein F [Janthinobacterium sp. NKUCC08_JDC]|uniref:PRTRC system protein F n=1 Tax=Janthinobacterium sp. NKUCC08_JDC TaxID=2842122 RepID=UPI001C5B30CF|nr:PRTRC system protein F [Janthinobacterium sp. NKUCC08_JDC]MBW3496954.1 PRTRC system protein F [Janthinobacterium sp. NKUCC08_JDC]
MNALATLALPALNPSIPAAMTLRQENYIVKPLAIALLEANLITDAMLQPRPNMPLVEVFNFPDERALIISSLSKWWNSIQYQAKHFNWQLHVQALDDLTGTHSHQDGTVWFCLERTTNTDIPRWTLAARIMKLENTLPGFGQTVLALLLDAVQHLPNALDLWFADSLAQSFAWGDSANDAELLENTRIDMGYATVQEVLDDGHVITREEFYRDMPMWAVNPKRVCTRDEIAAAAKSAFDRDVIGACDAISRLACDPAFNMHSHQVGAHQAGCDSIDGCFVLLWKEGDPVSRLIDNHLNDLGNCGEYNEFIDVTPIKPSAMAIREYQARTASIMRLAEVTENLLDLVGEPF